MRAIGVERVLTTQLDAGVGLSIGAESDLEARSTTQQVLHRARVLVGNLLGVDLYDRTRQVLLAHCTVTHHNHCLQGLRVFLKDDVHRLSAFEGDFLGGIANVGDDQRALCRYIRQFEVAVEVGHSAYCSGILHLHGGTDNRLTIFVCYLAIHHSTLLY